jgi:hypothetical protein
MIVKGTLLLRWKKRGLEPQDSPATNFDVAVVRSGKKVSVIGQLNGRKFDMTVSAEDGVRIQHGSFRENRMIKWVAAIGHVSVHLADRGAAFLVRFDQTSLGTNDGAYRILAGSVIAGED